MKPVIISVVIPVKNGSTTIRACLEGIQNQTLFPECEIVIVDSGSTDDTIDIVKQYDVKLIEIEPSEFNHGATRNFAVQHCTGKFVVMTVQDAVAKDQYWLETMYTHFNDDDVMAVCGQQVVPHDVDKNPHQWFRPVSAARPMTVQFENPEQFLNLKPEKQRELCGWDDVNAMYRKSALIAIPFEKLAFGEDMLWAKMALQAGYKIVYDYSSRVYHYHFQSPDYTYRRTLITKLFIYKCFGYIPKSTYGLKAYVLVIYRNFKWKLPLKWIKHNFNIITYHKKATADFMDAVNKNTIDQLEMDLIGNVPMGKQNTAANVK